MTINDTQQESGGLDKSNNVSRHYPLCFAWSFFVIIFC